MSEIVVDASAALSWVLRSQATAASRRFIVETAGRRLRAPFVFGWEVENTLLSLLRKGRLSGPAYDDASALLRSYDVRLGSPFHGRDMLAIAQAERLSLFDAAYLSDALEDGAELASRDRALLEAGRRHRLRTHDLTAAEA